MKSKKIEVKAGNVKVTIYVISRIKHGRPYVEYKLADRTKGSRQLLTFKNEAEARQRAGEIVEATNQGQLEVASWTTKQKRELTESMDLLKPYGITVRAAVTACCNAMQMIKTRDSAELLVAAQFYRMNRPDKPLIPKLVGEAVEEYLLRRKGLSAKRQASLACLLGQFSKKFLERTLDQIEAAEISDFIATKNWKPKSVNDFLVAVSLLYKDAILHNHAALNPAAPDRIQR